jgi:predicted RNA-binding Zn-ribbon protein involved in translation (DUF1610 family)
MTEMSLPLELEAPTQPEVDFTDDLRGRLAHLRTLPGFPLGTEDAILEMSRPMGMTACPNPYGESLVPVRSSDERRSDPGPFAADISAGKSHAIYRAHGYPTKVPHLAIMRFILHYTEPGDLVLDGFSGTGMTGVAAQACGEPDRATRDEIEAELAAPKWGTRRAYLQDLAPSASFIASGLNLPVDAEEFDRRSREILAEFDAEYGWMYETTTQAGDSATIDYTVWSEVFTCPHCGSAVIFFDAAFDTSTGRVRDTFTCPSCGGSVTKSTLHRRKTTTRTLAGDSIERIDLRPVEIHYRSGKVVGTKRPDSRDLETLRRVATLSLSGFPTDPLPLAEMTHGSRLGPKGFTHIHHLWGDRALAALAVLWQKTSSEPDVLLRGALRFWLDQALWGFSWMNRHKTIQFGRMGGSAVNNYMSGVYYIPSLHAEPSVRYNLDGSNPKRGKRAALVDLWKSSPARSGQVRISTGSSTQIGLPDASVDYVFVDPPFGSNIPYADLALVVESWHRVRTNVAEEAILDSFRHKRLPEYTALMTACFREFFRVLKPGRWMTVEFNNSSNRVWLGIQEALAEVGFVVADTRIFDKEQLSYRQVTAKNAVKRDLIISVYKPAEALEERFRLTAGTPDGVWAFVREHLAHLPVTEVVNGKAKVIRERQPDRLWDRMVAYHVAHGISVPIATTAEFNAGINEKFLRRDGMYFLPDQTERYERFLLTVRGVEQQSMFITSEGTAIQWLRDRLSRRSMTYAEIQPEFFAEAQAGAAAWDELPDLRLMLDENFVQDESSGRWRAPDSRKAADMEQVKTRAFLREFAKYAEGKGRLTQARGEVLRAGFKDAWGRKDFDMVVTVGKRLPEDAFADDSTLLYYYRNAERLATV